MSEKRVNKNNRDMVRMTTWVTREQYVLLHAIKDQCDIPVAGQVRRALRDWILKCRDASVDRAVRGKIEQKDVA